MRELAAIEVDLLVRELKRIEGMYIKKFYDLGDNSFKISVSGKDGTLMLYLRLLRTFNISAFSEPAEEATNFAMAMRKRIAGSRIESVSQHGADRIIILGIRGKDRRYSLVAEMFGKGNLMLVGEDQRIEIAYRNASMKDREIRARQLYAFPKSEPFDFHGGITDEKATEIAEGATNEDTKLIKALSKRLDIGPLYLEDIITRAGLDPNMKASDAARHSDRLAREIRAFFAAIKEEKTRIYMDQNGRMIDYAIKAIKKYDADRCTYYDTPSKALDAFYLEERSSARETEDRESLQIQESVKRQNELIIRYRAEENEDREAGDLVFKNMSRLNELIGYVREKKRVGLEELRVAFPDLSVKSIDLKNKTVEIEI